MQRRTFIKSLGGLSLGLATGLWSSSAQAAAPQSLRREDFGADFKWGVATAAYQIEGAWNEDGKSPSVWDHFTQKRPGKIKGRGNGNIACDFYHRYEGDIALVKAMNFGVYRFSVAWTRILPQGTGEVNQAGIAFYQRVIDTCLQQGVEPWITLYHWDLPQCLEDKGGWANREVLAWFAEFCEVVTKAYGDKVKNWMVLNEPAAFTALGYLGGIHAPGRVNPRKFLAATHHASLSMGIGGRIIRANVPGARVGTTFSCSPVEPKRPRPRHVKAAQRLDALLNRLFIEPVLGLGYPTESLPMLRGLKRYIYPGDMAKLPFKFDFIGLQNYTRIVARPAWYIPFMRANQVQPQRRGVSAADRTLMNWEVHPEGMYKILQQFGGYPNLPPIIITENGAAFEDAVTADDLVHDQKRVQFFQSYLAQILKAKRQGLDIQGYFVWTLMDNFEWAEGYAPRFGLVHVDFESQKRRIKDSGLWFKTFLG